MMTEEMSIPRVVARVLRDHGVEWVFGVVGSGNFAVTDALVAAGAHYRAARHEAGALGMADGVYRSSGKIAVCSVHQGPGFTNTLTALTEAAKSRTPLVVVAGATSAGSDRSNFEIDQEVLARTAGAQSLTLTSDPEIIESLSAAIDAAVAQQRPLVVNMPLDVQGASVPIPSVWPEPGEGDRQLLTDPDRDALVSALNGAERPVFIAGRGAWVSGSEGALKDLVERTGAVLANTAVVKGFAEGHASSVGISGGFSHDIAVQALEQADLIVGLGCSFTRWTTRSNTIFDDSTTVVQVDTDRQALGLNDRVDLEICADVFEVVNGLMQDDRLVEREPWFGEVGAQAASAAGFDSASGFHPRELTAMLDQMLPAQRTVTIDGGHFIGWPATGLTVPDPSGFLFSSAGFQSIGLGLGTAIGAAFARPDRLSVLVVGDGGFLMSLADLETVVRYDLPLLVVIYDDEAYGAEVHHFGPEGAELGIVRFPPTAIAEFVTGLGGQGSTVTSVEDLQVARDWLSAPRGLFVLDVKIDPSVVGFWAEQDFLGH